MADYRQAQLICKHFNIGLEYVNDRMPFDEWYCCLAVALDTEEDEVYDRNLTAYISAGGDPKKFPKRQERETRSGGGVTGEEILQKAMAAGIPVSKGNLEEYARIRNMKRVFQHADGTFRDGDGNIVEPPPGSVYVPVKKH